MQLYINKKSLITIKLKKLAGLAGFEPTNDGVKVHCLTAWRQPNN